MIRTSTTNTSTVPPKWWPDVPARLCAGDEQAYQSLRELARRLGAKFQKVNFLRDIRSDFDERVASISPASTFPVSTMPRSNRSKPTSKRILRRASRHSSIAERRPAWVMVAYIYYRALFRKIRLLPAQRIRQERIRVPIRKIPVADPNLVAPSFQAGLIMRGSILLFLLLPSYPPPFNRKKYANYSGKRVRTRP